MALDFSTANGASFEEAFDTDGILRRGSWYGHYNISHNFIDRISKFSRIDGERPNEINLGRECYSFSEQENRAFVIAIGEARRIATDIGGKIDIQTDPLGNLYIRVPGELEKSGDEYENHMIGSHLDSVRNGGKYDGVAGIATGLETLAQALYYQSQGDLLHSFCLTVFRSEESGPNNGIACLGSAIATGTITEDRLESIVYKKENGKDVLLRDHLESSLRKYFQASASLKESTDIFPSWGKGEEYVDHEWWYYFCKAHNLIEDDYTTGTWWEKIKTSLSHPKISKENTHSYHELHIEQGTLIENARVDEEQAQLGVVSGGIGGAKRYKTVEPISVQTDVLSSSDYEVYNFEVFGFSDHTGSTPNNPSLESSEYRKDANIAVNLFLRAFLDNNFGELISSQAENDEGYTKVPYRQRLSLAIKKSQKNQFTQFVRNQRRILREENGIRFGRGRYSQVKDNITSISRESARSTIGSLIGVSESASNAFLRQKSDSLAKKQFGTTRATLTNVHISPVGVSFCLDIREIDNDDVEALLVGVSDALVEIIPEGINGLSKVSEKVHEEISNELRDRMKKISDILGYVSIFLPSIPGHDADRVASVGIPIGMIFVKQKDGVSHNPSEKMDKQDYNVACHTMMKAVLANLV